MKITLKALTIVNFKGIRNLNIDFAHVTNIYGENGLGKTSILDAFSWLCWGKDSSDRKEFEIQTLDADNQIIPKLEVEVSAVFDVDGHENVARKVLKEIWSTKRGEAVACKTGNETSYWWNDAPLKKSEFEVKFSGIITEQLFKLITNTLYFNSVMKWPERRTVLMDIAGNISDYEVADTDPEFKKLFAKLERPKKTLEEYAKQVATSKTKLKDELKMIPPRIDELRRSLPEGIDFSHIRTMISQKESEAHDIDMQLMDHNSRQQEINAAETQKQGRVYELQTKIREHVFAITTSFNGAKLTRERELIELRASHRQVTGSINRLTTSIAALIARKSKLNGQLNEQRTKWTAINSETLEFTEGQFECPACRRPLDPEKVDNSKAELTNNFNRSKSTRLEEVIARADEIKVDLVNLETELSDLNAEHAEVVSSAASCEQQITEKQAEDLRLNTNATEQIASLINANADIKKMNDQIEQLQREIAQRSTDPTHSDSADLLLSLKRTVSMELDGFKKDLVKEDQILITNTRINELSDQETSVAQQIAELDGMEFLILRFNKAKMDMIQSRINGRFAFVTFKLFETQLNGGEIPCCETLINGVPFTDANNAAKINAGLDIINTLCEHYQVWAPIFIDNRESVNKLIDSKSQIVNLIVSKDSKLKVA